MNRLGNNSFGHTHSLFQKGVISKSVWSPCLPRLHLYNKILKLLCFFLAILYKIEFMFDSGNPNHCDQKWFDTTKTCRTKFPRVPATRACASTWIPHVEWSRAVFCHVKIWALTLTRVWIKNMKFVVALVASHVASALARVVFHDSDDVTSRVQHSCSETCCDHHNRNIYLKK